MLFIKASGNVMRHQFSGRGCLLQPDVEQCSAFCSSQNPSPVSARRAYPGGTARVVVQIVPAGYATGRELPYRSQTGDRDPADNPPAHEAAAGLVRRALLAFTPDGDVGNCLLQGFTGSH